MNTEQKLRALVAAQDNIIKAQSDLLTCYRVGDRGQADSALTRLERYRERADKLRQKLSEVVS